MNKSRVYIQAAMKAARIKNLSYNGFVATTMEEDSQVTTFINTLRSIGFTGTLDSENSNQATYSKDDESVTVNYRHGELGLNAFWIN